MHKHPQITDKRIEVAIERRLRPLVHREQCEVTVSKWDVNGEPVSYAMAVAADYQPFAVGDRWGGAWDTTWFRIRATVPMTWAGQDVRLRVDLGPDPTWCEGISCEGLVYQDGQPTTAINLYRDDAVHLTRVAGGETIELYIEAAANIRPENVADGSWRVDRDFGGPGRFTLKRCELATYDAKAERLLFCFELLAGMLKVVPADTPRHGQIRYALNACLNALDENQPASTGDALDRLKPVLDKRNGDTAHTIYAVGHAHIDTAWLWPLRETIRKCARTFSTALRYMDQYPDFVFACSQPQQYAWMKRHYPAIYEKIKRAVQRGQWRPIGSMWIEADCNIPSGESLVRQLLHGKRFFQREFGIDTKELWIPDVFGYSAALPQLLKQAGVDSFLTQKISWNQFNRFPHHTFLWRGLDGTGVFTHFPPANTYNGSFTAEEVHRSASRFLEHDRATVSLYPFGHGDGGGGPSRQMIENARLLNDLEAMPRVRLTGTDEFFEAAKRDAIDLPVWSGELYLEFHRGTYTTQAAVKRGNREGEQALHDAEFFDAIATLLGLDTDDIDPAEPPSALYEATSEIDAKERAGRAATLDRAWKLLLLNQFHDIIPGSSIRWVYEDAARDYQVIADLASRVRDAALRPILLGLDAGGMKRPIAVFNTLGHDRSEIVDVPGAGLRQINVPACGCRLIDAQAPDAETSSRVTIHTQDRQLRLGNGLVTLTLDTKTGELVSIIDHRANDREVLAAMPGETQVAGNLLQLHPDRPNQWDAWDIDIHAYEQCETVRGADRVEVVEQGPLRVVVQLDRSFGSSTMQQRIVLTAGSARIDFETTVDWQDRHTLLKVAFPVSVSCGRATYETQFGHVERPTHTNTTWDLARFEVCGHRWADLSEGGGDDTGGFGVALLNDCKYGYDIHDHVLRLSLLRGTVEPDPDADRGEHRFTYALLPHPGDFRQAAVAEQAANLNSLLIVEPVPNNASSQAKVASGQTGWLKVEPAGVVLDTLKVAEDGDGLIVRLYESFGRRCSATLSLPASVSRVDRCNLLEDDQQACDLTSQAVHLNLKPFEVLTLRIR